MFLGFFAAVVALSVIVYSATRIPLPDDVALPQQTQLTYADGSPFSTIGQVNRVTVSLSDVPVPVRDAVLAAEDRNFYNEPGISVRGIGRALLADVTGGGVKQGGSTITQQYAKNAYLGQERTLTRKLKEIVLAVKIDRKYSKDQVLEFYLNTIYFGRGAYGIQAASEAYFGVPVGSLTAAQGAVIAGLIRAPSVLDPVVSPNSAKVRWTQVVDQMVKDKALTPAQRAALVYPTTIPRKTATERASVSGPTSYINTAVEQFLVGQLGHATVDLGGLTVTTTIDKTAQAAAENAINAQTKDAPANLRPALVAVDPTTGAVRAYYGGAVAGQADAADFLDPQPGSSFKPITLAAALAGGAKLTDTYSGKSPLDIDGTKVRNFGNEQFGTINLLTATEESVNTVYLQLAQATGPAKIVSLARAMGVGSSTKLAAVPEIALGTEGVHALDMAGVYTAFATGGQAATPYFVQKVTDRKGRVLYQAKPQTHQVFSSDVAADATAAMRAVVTGGTARAARLSGGRQAAGKTGTTDNNISAWFDGYTPQLVAVVSFSQWTNGAAQPLTPYKQCGCKEVTGGTLPAKTWKQFMDAALAGKPKLPFPASSVPIPTTSTATPTPTSSDTSTATATPTSTPSGTVTPTGIPTGGLPSLSPGLATVPGRRD